MRLNLRLLFIFLLSCTFITATGRSSEMNPAKLDSLRIARLCGLCKLWGAIKYFHPYLAYKEIDWDSALVQTIPKVSQSQSREDYQGAIDNLLSFLKDPNTHVIKKTEMNVTAAETKSPYQQPYLNWTRDSVAIIVANDYGQFTDFSKLTLFQKVFVEVAKARAVVFDLRARCGYDKEFGDFWLHYLFSQAFPTLLSEKVTLSTSRHRMHSGYADQTGGYTPYYSAFVAKEGATFSASATKTLQQQFAFLINDRTTSFAALLGGLQAAGIAAVVYEGEASEEAGIESYSMELPDSVSVIMSTGEIVNPDGSLGFHPDIVVPFSPDTSLTSSPAIRAALETLAAKKLPKQNHRSTALPAKQHLEKPYNEMVFPAAEYRLLALFRFWNVIHYFFPYKLLMDRTWDEVLPEFIPRFEAAKDSLEYVLTNTEMVRHIQDTHAFINSKILIQYYGTHQPPVEVTFIEGQTVVTYVPDSVKQSTGLNLGDVILAVDGEEITQRRERLGKTLRASTPQALAWRIHRVVLGGSDKSNANLKVKDKSGNVVELIVPRSVTFMPHERQTPMFSVLPEGFGYIELDRLTVAEIDTALETINATPGVIFDMRGYPNGTAWSLAPRLASKRAITARFQTPELHSPDSTWNSIGTGYQTVEPSEKWRYTGKVVVLINEEAISHAEHTCLYLEAATDVTFVGTPTNGANGNVTTTVLPGGINVTFTGMDVRHGDGRQLQRIGIQPHIRVEPTIAGVRNGRDEVLDKAITFLKKHTKK